MTKHILFSTILAGCLMAACTKSLSTGDAGFEVAVNATEIGVGDSAIFSFQGNPDIINFFSGQPGNRYQYLHRDTASGTPLLRFRSARPSGSGSQANSLSVMVSDNFEGVLVSDTPTTVNRINAANWVNITSRGTLATGTAAVFSGNMDLSDFAAAGKPVYIAFRYNGYTGSTQNKWLIDSFTVRNVLNDGTSYVIANLNASNVAYKNYDVNAYSPGFAAFRPVNRFFWAITNGTSLAINGDAATNSLAASEAWAIIGPINLKKVSPDVARSVKTVAQRTEELQVIQTYSTPGTYQAVFTGGKLDADKADITTRTIQITVK